MFCKHGIVGQLNSSLFAVLGFLFCVGRDMYIGQGCMLSGGSQWVIFGQAWLFPKAIILFCRLSSLKTPAAVLHGAVWATWEVTLAIASGLVRPLQQADLPGFAR